MVCNILAVAPVLAAAAILSPAVVLPILGVAAAGALVFLVVSAARSQKSGSSGILGHLLNWNQSPEMQLVAKAAARRIEKFGEDTGHALLDTLILKVAPPAAPLIPGINALAEKAEKRLAGEGAPATQPASGPLAPVPPPGHPVWQLYDLLCKATDAWLEQHKQQSKSA